MVQFSSVASHLNLFNFERVKTRSVNERGT